MLPHSVRRSENHRVNLIYFFRVFRKDVKTYLTEQTHVSTYVSVHSYSLLRHFEVQHQIH